MVKKRVFIAINLPGRVKNKLVEIQKTFKDQAFRWTKADNLHITLFFLGLLNDEQILDVCALVKKVCAGHKPFEIVLDKVCVGPPHGPARMIWVCGRVSEELSRLKNELESSLLQSQAATNLSAFSKSDFKPHITLIRIKQGRFPKDSPKPDRSIGLEFVAESVEIMESRLSGDGPEYFVLESVGLYED